MLGVSDQLLDVLLMDLDPASETHLRALPWPEDLRARIEAFGVRAQDA